MDLAGAAEASPSRALELLNRQAGWCAAAEEGATDCCSACSCPRPPALPAALRSRLRNFFNVIKHSDGGSPYKSVDKAYARPPRRGDENGEACITPIYKLFLWREKGVDMDPNLARGYTPQMPYTLRFFLYTFTGMASLPCRCIQQAVQECMQQSAMRATFGQTGGQRRHRSPPDPRGPPC